jgi:hypothetical protein
MLQALLEGMLQAMLQALLEGMLQAMLQAFFSICGILRIANEYYAFYAPSIPWSNAWRNA